jgi:hypothetical protein
VAFDGAENPPEETTDERELAVDIENALASVGAVVVKALWWKIEDLLMICSCCCCCCSCPTPLMR